MNKKIIFALGILVIISLICPLFPSVLKAEIDSTGSTSEVVGSGDVFESAPGLTLNDVPTDGSPGIVTDSYGNTVLTDKGDSVGIERNIYIPASFDANGNPIPFDSNSLLTGLDAARDQTASKNYEKGDWDAFGNNQFAVFDKDKMKVEYNPETKTYDVKLNAEISKADLAANAQRMEAADRIISGIKRGENIEKLVNDIIKNTLKFTKENTVSKAQREFLLSLAKDPKKAEQWKAWLAAQQVIMANVKYIPPKQKVEKSPVPSDGGACAAWNAQGQPGPVTCLGAGTKTGFRSPCTVSQTQEFMSSYTTTVPNNSDPFIKGRQPFCDDQREGYLDFSKIMNTFGNRVWSKDDLMNNGVSAFNRFRMQDRFANNPWKSSWRGEVREWNPFKEGNKLSDIPYQIIWGDMLDSWTDADHKINPMITESINHKNKAERSNAAFTAKYGINNPLKVYNNAPNPRMRVTALDLDNNAWNESETANIFSTGKYDMKIEPRYDIQRWDRYRLFDLHNFFTYRI